MKFSTLMSLGALAVVASAAPTVEKRSTVPTGQGLKYKLTSSPFREAAKHGHTKSWLAAIGAYKARLWIGHATEVYTLNPDPAYKAISESGEFSRVTPENSMKWESIEPQEGVFDFANADALMAYAKENNQAVRGHTLVWHSQLPAWINTPAVPWTYDTLKPILERHVRTVVRHFKGRIDMWDVVNEMFLDDGTYRPSVFYNIFGTDFVRWALTWAHEEDPDCLLFINDYNFEYLGAKVNNATAFFKTLVDEGYPLGAVGAQAHMIVGQVSEAGNTAAFKQFTDFGLLLYLTELDIRFDIQKGNSVSNYTAADLEQQAKDYYAVTRACMNVDNCLGITLWQFTDKYSWIPGVFPGQGAALPWDDMLNKKPAYKAMQQALGSVPYSA